jgi:hypothetical protein
LITAALSAAIARAALTGPVVIVHRTVTVAPASPRRPVAVHPRAGAVPRSGRESATGAIISGAIASGGEALFKLGTLFVVEDVFDLLHHRSCCLRLISSCIS